MHQVETVYTCDTGLAALARAEKLRVLHIADLPLPPVEAQPDVWEQDGAK